MAIMTSPRANKSMSSESERRSGRPARRLRAASTPTPDKQAMLTSTN